MILYRTVDNQVRERAETLRKTESTIRSQKPNDCEDTLAQNRSQDNVFKASGAESEKAKQVEDDKGITPRFFLACTLQVRIRNVVFLIRCRGENRKAHRPSPS